MSEKHKIEEVLEAFRGYIKEKADIEIFWSEKERSYFVINWDMDDEYVSVKRFETGIDACDFLLNEIYKDQYMKYELHKMSGLSKMNEEQTRETHSIMMAYLEQLPEYMSLVEGYVKR